MDSSTRPACTRWAACAYRTECLFLLPKSKPATCWAAVIQFITLPSYQPSHSSIPQTNHIQQAHLFPMRPITYICMFNAAIRCKKELSYEILSIAVCPYNLQAPSPPPLTTSGLKPALIPTPHQVHSHSHIHSLSPSRAHTAPSVKTSSSAETRPKTPKQTSKEANPNLV